MFPGSKFLGSHRRLRTPSTTFWTFIVGVSKPVQGFHLREYLTLLTITRHKFFFPCHETMQLCWTSSNVLSSPIKSPSIEFNYTHALTPMHCLCAYAMQCVIARQFHAPYIMNAIWTYTIHTSYHASWIIIL